VRERKRGRKKRILEKKNKEISKKGEVLLKNLPSASMDNQ